MRGAGAAPKPKVNPDSTQQQPGWPFEPKISPQNTSRGLLQEVNPNWWLPFGSVSPTSIKQYPQTKTHTHTHRHPEVGKYTWNPNNLHHFWEGSLPFHLVKTPGKKKKCPAVISSFLNQQGKLNNIHSSGKFPVTESISRAKIGAAKQSPLSKARVAHEGISASIPMARGWAWGTRLW